MGLYKLLNDIDYIRLKFVGTRYNKNLGYTWLLSSLQNQPRSFVSFRSVYFIHRLLLLSSRASSNAGKKTTRLERRQSRTEATPIEVQVDEGQQQELIMDREGETAWWGKWTVSRPCGCKWQTMKEQH